MNTNMYWSLLILGLTAMVQDVYSRGLNLTAYMTFSNNCECGRLPEGIQTRIVGGLEAKEHGYPWLVGILNKNKMHCGGSLINDRYVLTAGHCLNWDDVNNMTVVLAMHDRVRMERNQKGGIVAVIKNGIVHEDFSSDYLHDSEDIALIRLEEPVKFSNEVSTVCLPIGELDRPEGKRATVVGWGRTTEGGLPSRRLQQATLRIMPEEECKNVTTIGEHITGTVLCGYEKSVDACQGDSGGPLVWESRNRFEQIGLVSWGIGCAKPGLPGIYTRVSQYLEWIVAHTRDAIYCKDPVLNYRK